jgi:hypothetical protein
MEWTPRDENKGEKEGCKQFNIHVFHQCEQGQKPTFGRNQGMSVHTVHTNLLVL